jgi:DNA-binding XRE family transcriptional regulator
MTEERRDYTRGHIWRKLGGKRRKAWKDAYRRLAHGRGGVFPGVVKLGRRPDPPLELDDRDEQSRQALMNLGRAVRELREQRGVSVSALAEAADMTRECLQALEAGQVDPHFDTLLALADGMRIRPQAIFKRAEELHAEP